MATKMKLRKVGTSLGFSVPRDVVHDLGLAEGDEFIPSYWVKPRRLQLHVGIEF